MADGPVQDDVADEPLEAAGLKALESERKARRTAEKRLEALDGRVQALQIAEVERVAGAAMADPSDLWRADGVELAAMLNDAGDIDQDRVREAVGTVLET